MSKTGRERTGSAFDDTGSGGRGLKAVLGMLNPARQIRNPVMFAVYLGAALATVAGAAASAGWLGDPAGYTWGVAVCLWIMVIAAGLAEGLGAGAGKPQAVPAQDSKREGEAFRLQGPEDRTKGRLVSVGSLKKGDYVLVRAGEQIPADGEVVDGAASVDESAITGESAPVIRESGSVRSAVTGGTTVISDWIVVRITDAAGEGFLNQMQNGADRTQKRCPMGPAQKVLLGASAALVAAAAVLIAAGGRAGELPVTALIALFVCLAPTAMGAICYAVEAAGMRRWRRINVLSPKAHTMEQAGRIDVIMLDKKGTITLGNRQASEFIPVDGTSAADAADAAQLAALADESPESRSIVVLAKEQFGIRARELQSSHMEILPQRNTDRTVVRYGGDEYCKGTADAVGDYIEKNGGAVSSQCRAVVKQIISHGGTPVLITKNARVCCVVNLKDVIRRGVQDKVAEIRKMGVKTVMITADHPLTAAAIAAEAGVDDFLADAEPQKILDAMRQMQKKGCRVAVTGALREELPVLGQADLAVAMNSGPQEVRKSGALVDMDSSPVKLIEIVKAGKQFLNVQRRMRVFGTAGDIAKFAVLLPVLAAEVFPRWEAWNVLGLGSLESAVLAAVVYSVFVLLLTLPLALKGVRGSGGLAGKGTLWLCGAAGAILPLAGIKLIDLILNGLRML